MEGLPLAPARGGDQNEKACRGGKPQIFQEFRIGQDEVFLFCIHETQEVDLSVSSLDFARASFVAAGFPGGGFDPADNFPVF